MAENAIIKKEEIQSRIYTIRNVQVMLDRDLSILYKVETGALNQAKQG
ncbi:MAG: ORF6N domain-containing protein [Candidatus Marinimicrobia bacterium]|nr:ORF6N domain-containing protein [Candidatus Neomarinimicrobiota bacterium]